MSDIADKLKAVTDEVGPHLVALRLMRIRRRLQPAKLRTAADAMMRAARTLRELLQ